MRFLITNDDGIHGKGLEILERVAKRLSDDVWVVAPDLDQSGAGHSLTLRSPLRIRSIDSNHYVVTGTPTDCVLAGVFHIMKDKKPTIILSGINDGANVAEDITYSGTVAGAMEGCLIGIPSIALSLVRDFSKDPFWESAEEGAYQVLQKILTLPLDEGCFLNVNIPHCPLHAIQGMRATTQGHRSFLSDPLVEKKDPRGNTYYWIGPGHSFDSMKDGLQDTDLEALSNNFISITPLCVDFTHKKMLNTLVEEMKR